MNYPVKTLLLVAVVAVSVSTTTRTIHVPAEDVGASTNASEQTEARKSATMTRVVTAYTLGRVEETDDSPCIGASNKDLCEIVRNGIGVCASNEFPLYTRLMVGDFECIVLDRMNARYPDRIDIAMLEYWQARMFGKQNLPIAIIHD